MKTSDRMSPPDAQVVHAKMWYRIAVILIPVWLVMGIMIGTGVCTLIG